MYIALFLVGGLLLLGIGSIVFYRNKFLKPGPFYFLGFLKKNIDNKRAAASIHYNEKPFAAINESLRMPLASTVKILVAIEFARQVSDGKLNPEESVAREALDTFYVAKTDGGAHQAWLDSLSFEKEPTLKQIASGMIVFSSNANTDYLISRLGLNQINQLIQLLELDTHDPLYPIVSAIAIPKNLMVENGLSHEQMVQELNDMEMTEYTERTIQIHQQWLQSPLTNAEKESFIKTLDMEVQQIWSNWLPGSTTSDYLSIMKKLNNKTYFDPSVYAHLDPLLEQMMENPANQTWLKHAGQKGGATAFVLTLSMYATDKEGNQTELVVMMNHLHMSEQVKLSASLNAFQLKFLKSKAFRKQLKAY